MLERCLQTLSAASISREMSGVAKIYCRTSFVANIFTWDIVSIIRGEYWFQASP